MTAEKGIRYRWIDGVEVLRRYEPGGYHPVMVNDLLHDRYRVVDKLGYGSYSTVWLCHDVQLERYVAVKVGTSSRHAPNREPATLRELSSSRSSHPANPAIDGSKAILRILDDFTVQGPNGSHPCYAMVPAQGSLGHAAENCIFPIRVARALTAKLAMAVAFVHSQ
ncbi:hypothetical protein IMZ48_40070, partial [Candidatus Bathyarchaeota archaeon]|nr:hypothetical protein [Candidatus Bathyarchaeota archaeon]